MSLFVSNVVHVFYQSVSIFKVIYLINSRGVKMCPVCLCLSDSAYSCSSIKLSTSHAMDGVGGCAVFCDSFTAFR